MSYTPLFDPEVQLDAAIPELPFPEGDRAEKPVYVYTPEIKLAVNVALATGRPLLHRGDWLSVHPIEAGSDPVSCTRCHAAPGNVPGPTMSTRRAPGNPQIPIVPQQVWPSCLLARRTGSRRSRSVAKVFFSSLIRQRFRNGKRCPG